MAYRDTTLQGISPVDAGRKVRLAGWVAGVRDHGGMVFFNLRDRYGVVQVTAGSQPPGIMEAARQLKPEYVVSVLGEIRPRPAGLANPGMPLGSVEIAAEEIEILNPSAPLPFVLAEGEEVSPAMRMKYRYLDMRRPAVRDALLLRSKTAMEARNFLASKGFVEVETPMLTRSTPEGARDFLVPSRVHPNTCYALPQSPQLFKQLLMIGGFDRYFQIVKCFRDEDQRADRQPEFTQIDVEMSFVVADDVMAVAEELALQLLSKIAGATLPSPLMRMKFSDAMNMYGSDKPDLRFGLEIADATACAAGCGFKAFASAAAEGGVVRGLRVPGAAGWSRKQISEVEDAAKKAGLPGLAVFKAEASGLASSIAKHFERSSLESIARALSAGPGDLLLLAAGRKKTVSKGLGEVRLKIGRDSGLAKPGDFKMFWIVDPPLLEYNEEEKRLDAVHHPFTMPRPEDVPLLDTNPEAVRAQAYDLVLNGHEVAGGSIRIHRQDLQEKVFGLIAIDKATAREKFGFLLEALTFGAPPHGGIAFGFDRFVAMLLGTDNITGVIAFPKTTRAFCPLTGAPGPVSDRQMEDLGIAWRDASRKGEMPVDGNE